MSTRGFAQIRSTFELCSSNFLILETHRINTFVTNKERIKLLMIELKNIRIIRIIRRIVRS